MSRKQLLIRGTLILTFTGFLSRFMGFFYRIFLSRTFGSEGVGLVSAYFSGLCALLLTHYRRNRNRHLALCRL